MGRVVAADLPEAKQLPWLRSQGMEPTELVLDVSDANQASRCVSES